MPPKRYDRTRSNLSLRDMQVLGRMKKDYLQLQAEIKSLKQRVDQLEKDTSPHRMAGYD